MSTFRLIKNMQDIYHQITLIYTSFQQYIIFTVILLYIAPFHTYLSNPAQDCSLYQ